MTKDNFNYNNINQRHIAPHLLKLYGVDVEIAKAEFDTMQRKELAKKGIAMKDGSYPIRNAKDLSNAVKDWGRGGAREDVKNHIKERAKALGLSDSLPPNWKEKKEVEKAEDKKKAMGTGNTPAGKETLEKDDWDTSGDAPQEMYASEDKSAEQKKVKKVMDEWKSGKLHSGSKKGPEVTSQKQAEAIAISEAKHDVNKAAISGTTNDNINDDENNEIAAKKANKQVNKSEATGKELDELITEHEKLVKILESSSKEDDRAEAKKQRKELEGYKKRRAEEKEKEGIEKAEGAKGGKIIGHTKSGKPVYASLSASHEHYKNFTSGEHEEAAEHHYSEASKYHHGEGGGGQLRSHHNDLGAAHDKIAAKKEKEGKEVKKSEALSILGVK